MATKPGERRLQILQTLAGMLETPKGEKITTAALAAKLDCSEAALYRHFASKAQMFEGLIELIEQRQFGVHTQNTSEEPPRNTHDDACRTGRRRRTSRRSRRSGSSDHRRREAVWRDPRNDERNHRPRQR